MTRLVHHWHAPKIDGLAAGTPVRVQSDCGRSILVSVARVVAWRANASPVPPDSETCPACLRRQRDSVRSNTPERENNR